VALIFAAVKLPHPVPTSQIWDALISVGISIPFGIMQAHFTMLYEQDGTWYLRGDWRYVASWIALLGLKVATAFALGSTTASGPAAAEWIAALEVGVVWGLRSLVLHLRYPQLMHIMRRSQLS
jgi:hypothetical protein